MKTTTDDSDETDFDAITNCFSGWNRSFSCWNPK